MNIKLKAEYGRSWVINAQLKDEARKPVFIYGLDVPVSIELYHEDGSLYSSDELSVYEAFRFGIDSDYSSLTDPAVLTTEGFSVSDNIISFVADTNTARALEILGASGSAPVIAELKAYKSGEEKASFVAQFNCLLKNVVVDDNADPPPETQSDFFNKTQSDLRYINKSKFNLPVSSDLTISSGAITRTQSVHSITPESGTFDELATIDGLEAGPALFYLTLSSASHVIVFKTTGNILTPDGKDLTMTGNSYAVCYSDGTSVRVSINTDESAIYSNYKQLLTPDTPYSWVLGDKDSIIKARFSLTVTDGSEVNCWEGGILCNGSEIKILSSFFSSTVLFDQAQFETDRAAQYHWRGNWDASGGSYPEHSALKEYWRVSAAGNIDGHDYDIGDYFAWDGGDWNTAYTPSFYETYDNLGWAYSAQISGSDIIVVATPSTSGLWGVFGVQDLVKKPPIT